MKTNDFKLFLDDVRRPKDAYLYYGGGGNLLELSGTASSCWNIVRTYEQFEDWIKTFGVPAMVSFDHDLHFEHIRHYHETTSITGVIEYEKFLHKTGKHAAEFLVKAWKEARRPKITTFIHSANRWGQDEIAKVLAETKL